MRRSSAMQLNMTKGKPLPVILMFTIPLIIGNVFQQLYNMVDTIIVGRYVGADALAAVGSTGTIMFLITGFSQGITSGFSVRVSQKYGAMDKVAVKRNVANGILLSVISIMIMTAFTSSVMRPLLRLMNTPDNIYDMAYSYIIVICIGIAANIFYNLFSAYLRAVGNSQVPLFFLVFSACLNVVLDILFVVKMQMGVAGAAWATNLSQAISAVLCAVYIWVKVPDLKPEPDQWRISPQDTHPQLAAGIPMAFQFAITASGTMIMQSAINLFGSEAVAAYTAAGKLQNILTQGDGVAMGQTMATYGGQNYGCGNLKRIRAGVPCRSGCRIRLFYCGRSCYDSAFETMSSPFLLGRCGYDGHDAVGDNVLLHVCRFLSAALHNFYFPEYYAGMRIWFSAHDGWCVRADRKTHCIHDCNESFKLSAGMLR